MTGYTVGRNTKGSVVGIVRLVVVVLMAANAGVRGGIRIIPVMALVAVRNAGMCPR